MIVILVLNEIFCLISLLLNPFLRIIFYKNSKIHQILKSKTLWHFLKVKKKLKNKNHQPTILFHVASSGEFEQSKPLIQDLKKTHPQMRILISLYSPSGLSNVNHFPDVDDFFLTPLESFFLFQNLFRSSSFKQIFFLRYDIWPGILFAAKKEKIACSLLCAVSQISRNHFLSRWNRHFLTKKLYAQFDRIFPVNEESFHYFSQINPQTQEPLEDLKWIAAYRRSRYSSNLSQEKTALIQHLQALFQNKEASQKTLLFSSPHEEELDFIFELLQEEQGPFFCVPHQIEDLNLFLKRIEKHPRLQWISLGDLNHPPLTKSTFVLCPIFGWLAEFYRFFQGAFVGGGFDGQIHNVIEPFVLGLKVFSGPQIQKAPEALELKKKGFLFAEEKDTLKKILIEFLTSSSANKEPPADHLKEWSQSIPPKILERTFQNVSFKG